jgi:8-oxo-dGTP pyrophosphatase MutT (NUDIX family)
VTSCRARIVLVEDGSVAMIRRQWAGKTYYLFPGGGVHAGETPEQAAAREAREELGLEVGVGRLLHVEDFRGERYHYFEARRLGGEFGSGRGDEMVASGTTEAGTFEAVWLELTKLRSVQIGLDVQPHALVERLLSVP